MGSDALDDGVDLAAIFHMEPTAGNPDGSWRIFLNGMEPGARSSPAVNKVPAVSFQRQSAASSLQGSKVGRRTDKQWGRASIAPVGNDLRDRPPMAHPVSSAAG
jgi:hypothetical protein